MDIPFADANDGRATRTDVAPSDNVLMDDMGDSILIRVDLVKTVAETKLIDFASICGCGGTLLPEHAASTISALIVTLSRKAYTCSSPPVMRYGPQEDPYDPEAHKQTAGVRRSAILASFMGHQ